jgi:hypothetical protein
LLSRRAAAVGFLDPTPASPLAETDHSCTEDENQLQCPERKELAAANQQTPSDPYGSGKCYVKHAEARYLAALFKKFDRQRIGSISHANFVILLNREMRGNYTAEELQALLLVLGEDKRPNGISFRAFLWWWTGQTPSGRC